MAAPNRLNELTPVLQGQIADFLGPADKASMRLVSKENRVLYDSRPKRAFNIRQRLTLINLQSGEQRVYRTPNSVVTVNQFNLEVPHEQLTRFLNLTNVETKDSGWDDLFHPAPSLVGGWHNNFVGLTNQGRGNAFEALTQFLTADAAVANNQQYQDFVIRWPYINYLMTRNMFHRAFQLGEDEDGYKFTNYSLFTASELRELIREKEYRNQIPFTFVKVYEINLLDHAVIMRGPPEITPPVQVRTIDDMVNFQHTGFQPGEQMPHADDMGLRTLLTRYLGGDGSTSIDGLRPFARYRYIHEINIDQVVAEPRSFPMLPEEEGGASASSGGGGGGGASSGGGAKRRRE